MKRLILALGVFIGPQATLSQPFDQTNWHLHTTLFEASNGANALAMSPRDLAEDELTGEKLWIGVRCRDSELTVEAMIANTKLGDRSSQTRPMTASVRYAFDGEQPIEEVWLLANNEYSLDVSDDEAFAVDLLTRDVLDLEVIGLAGRVHNLYASLQWETTALAAVLDRCEVDLRNRA